MGWIDTAREISDSAGAAPLHAAWRQGLKELAQVVPAFPDSVRAVEEPGVAGNTTAQLVTEQVTGRGVDKDDNIAAKEPAKQPEKEVNEPEMD